MEARSFPPARGAGSALHRLIAGALVLFALAACGGNDDAAPPAAAAAGVAAVTVTLTADHVAVGQTATATAEARDASGAVVPGASFSWASSDSAVAAVADGVATGVAAGAARITASSGGVTSDPVTIAVVAVAKGSVAIDQASVFFTGAGQTRSLTALAADAQGAPVAGTLVWSSSAPDKVFVDAAGRLTALAIGSAQITAAVAGMVSAPTLVVVAEPQAGALLVRDAQVVSIGAPALAPGAGPGAPPQYDVTLQGVAAPLPGTVVLAGESAPIAGKVVATHLDGAGQLVVTLAVAPLPQLFRAYDIDWTIDLAAFPTEPTPTVQVALGAAWNNARSARSRALAARPLDAVGPFKPFECDQSVEGQIGERKATLSLDNKMTLVVKDKSGYSRHSLEGPVTLTGSASLKLNLGFKGSGKCEAAGQIRLPVLGWLSVIVMPAVRLGLGAQIDGEVIFAEGELGVDGSVGVDVLMGWECGGATPDCRSLDSRTPSSKLETKSKFPSAHDMKVKVSGQFYVLAGFDVVFFLGAGNAKIVEARGGPKQSFDLALEVDQAFRPDYASHYELTLDAVIEPGPALKEAIKRVIDDDAVEVKFKLETSAPLSESPKGTLSVSKARVAIGAPIDFTLNFDPATAFYAVLGYNIKGVQLYRRRDDEAVFTEWKAMDMVTDFTASYRWTPVAAEAGNYEFAAFVNTKVQPLPWLEVAPDSVKKVEVSCFSAINSVVPGGPRMRAAAAPRAGQAPTCADTWVGTTSTGDAINGPNQTEARLTLKVDDRVTGQGPGQVFYFAEGTLKVNRHVTDLNGVHCEYLPFEIVIDRNTGSDTPGHGAESNQFTVDYSQSPPTAGGAGVATGTQTIVCTIGTTTTTSTITNGYTFMGAPQGVLNADGLSWSASHLPFYSYSFARP